MRFSTYSLRAVFASLLLFFVHTASYAVDGVSFEGGFGDKVSMARVGFQWDFNKEWFSSNGTHLGGYWDLNLAYWHGTKYNNEDGRSQNIGVLGITPVFRFQKDSKKGPYIEGGIGANLFSSLYNNNGNHFSTAFQFGDHIGVGYVFDNKFDLGLKIQHYSNASIKSPNPGENFIVLRGSYRF